MVPGTTSKKTVLIADDTAFVRDRFRAALQTAGHQAVSVKSAAELLARVRADLPRIDLLVLDLRLPHAAGVEMVRSIRKPGRETASWSSAARSRTPRRSQLAALGVAE
jgi:CheY-like chemotaxis protein